MSYNGRRRKLRYTKSCHLSNYPKMPPISTFDLFDGVSKSTIPYRLPRISPGPCSSSCDDHYMEDNTDKIWGRFGYEEIVRIPALNPSVNKISVNPPSQTMNQHFRQSNLAVPRFRSAAILPLKASGSKEPQEFQVYRSLLEKAQLAENSGGITYPEPAPSPVSLLASASKSFKSSSIHWTLGNTRSRHPLYDKKGRSRAQGPFSREFTVTCFAPNNWLRLRLGRGRSAHVN